MRKNIDIMVYKFYTEGTKQKITSLPIDFEVLRELAAQKGWIISTYQAGRHIIKSLNYEDVAARKDSFTVQCKDHGKIIFYKDGLSLTKRNFALAHEFGHIVLEHTSAGILGESDDPAEELRQENEADSFAYSFLAPPIILHKCNVKNADEVERITLLDEVDAAVVYSRLRSIEDAVTEPELEMLEQFSGYIDDFIKNKRIYFFRTLLRKPSLYLACVILAFIVLSVSYIANSLTTLPISVEAPVVTETPAPIEPAEQTELPSEIQAPTEQIPVEQQSTAAQSSESVKSYSDIGTNRPSGSSRSSSVAAPTQQIIVTPAPTPPNTPQPMPPPTMQPAPVFEPQAVVPEVENDYTVYVTKTGYAYHKAGCGHLKNRQYSATTRNAAIANGKSACMDCNPG